MISKILNQFKIQSIPVKLVIIFYMLWFNIRSIQGLILTETSANNNILISQEYNYNTYINDDSGNDNRIDFTNLNNESSTNKKSFNNNKNINNKFNNENENFINKNLHNDENSGKSNINQSKDDNYYNKNKVYYDTNSMDSIPNNSSIFMDKELKHNDHFENLLRYNGSDIEPEWEWVKNISIVYTWVDGSDINFQNLKAKYNGGVYKVSSRDRSADELKYSIRSVEKYMPWHQGMIYIVTCHQIPEWLNLHNPRIKVIDHEIILPKGVYPTFNSNTIELFLDRIPGITEKFIYLNDDYLLNHYIHPSFLFSNDENFSPIIYKNNNTLNISQNSILNFISNGKKMFLTNCYLTDQLIKKYFDPEFKYFYIHHSIYVLYRDLFEPFRLLFKKELQSNLSDRFRNHYSIQTLYLYYAFVEYATSNEKYPLRMGGEGISRKYVGTIEQLANRTIQHYSIRVIQGEITNKYIKFCKIKNDSKANKKNFEHIKSHPEILVYNFNDEYSSSQVLYEFTEFLLTRHPEPSSFEKSNYISLENKLYSKLVAINDISSNISNSKKNIYNKPKIKIFNNVLQTYKIKDLIPNYIQLKNELSGPKKKVSEKEIEEIQLLHNYHGENLTSEWQWAKSISIVYLLENTLNLPKNSNRSNNFLLLNKLKNYLNKNYINNSNKISFKNFTEMKKSRLREIEELRYSLRSVDLYLPWFEGDIYIIGEGEQEEVLPWLNPQNKKVHWIHHYDLLPKTVGQTINRNIIETFLDKIPTLSERFIYLRPNHFFINPVHPRFFFDQQFNPKYNFEGPLSNEKKIEMNSNSKYSSFFYTYNIILEYFGRLGYRKYRILKNAPCPLYRDLFEPARQLYQDYIEDTINHMKKEKEKRQEFLSLYMVTSYNIYGTEHLFYPNYVIGYPKIKNAPLPILNENRTISIYGYDITTPEVSEKTMTVDVIFTNDFITNDTLIKKLIQLKKLFFSIKDTKDLNDYQTDKLLHNFYDKPSLYEL
ncbi:hypothetical protein LY90DRAFT_642245 [Neocallimastix californiae]|uniref:Stealth protein CR2 conserved region 2 domain-containing protein n=1 Tax=Neocallimastix californiae TaxID=1754190 RepID=A0A1Y2DWH5_9FUNG|nr:hypothetical protein LY90DRAFT_642245 [Neocallimastix californiae]|eukprot:ORY63650.1 hypothetical protein LY90DRAFT_642245 [Neocallimastix californiae]